MAVIHQSDISSWIRCPHAYMLSKAGHPQRQTSALSYGSVMHHALETFERMRHTEGVTFNQAVEAAVETFDHYWHPLNIETICPPVDLWLPRQTYGQMRDQGMDVIRAYATLMKFDDHELLATEYGFIVPIEGTWDEELEEPHVLAGTLDRLAVRHYGGKPAVAVDDFKTGQEYRYLRQNLQFTAYCASPETPVLMADLTWKPIEQVAPGDHIMAVDEELVPTNAGVNRRHWRTTAVTATWGVVKPAYRLQLSDGTSLVAGQGHRFLAQRAGRWSWRTVEDLVENLHNPRRKTAGIKIARVYRPESVFSLNYDSSEYMAGYIAGATLGDGSINAGRAIPFWQIVLGSTDHALLDRLRLYLHTFGINVHEFTREPDGRGWQRSQVAGLRTYQRNQVEAIQAMCAESSDCDEYAAGWLAGLYDTDGGISATSGTISYYQRDPSVLDLVAKRAEQLGFPVRIRGITAELVADRSERAAFTTLINPALDRKRERLDGRTVRIFENVRVTGIDELGPQRLIDITTESATYVADGIVSHNCYATTRPEFWTGWQGEDGFGKERGGELYDRFTRAGRRGTWINMRSVKFQDAGWRGPKDYVRFALAVEQVVASIRADIYPLSLSGEHCTYCTFRDVCAGVGVPENTHGAP